MEPFTDNIDVDDFDDKWPVIKHLTEEYQRMRVGMSKMTNANSWYAMRQWRAYLDNTKMTVRPEAASGYFQWISARRTTAASINAAIFPVRGWLSYLFKHGALKWDPEQAMPVRRTSRTSSRRAMEQGEAAKLLAATENALTEHDRQDALIVRLLLFCGLRASELMNIRIRDIQPRERDTICYILGKGRHDRDQFVVFPVEVKLAMDRYLMIRGAYGKDDCLVCNGRRTYKWLLNRVNAITMEILGKHVSPHVFRHTFATHSLRSGATLLQVQEAMRHTNVNSTQIYLHNLDRMKGAAEKIVNYGAA